MRPGCNLRDSLSNEIIHSASHSCVLLYILGILLLLLVLYVNRKRLHKFLKPIKYKIYYKMGKLDKILDSAYEIYESKDYAKVLELINNYLSSPELPKELVKKCRSLEEKCNKFIQKQKYMELEYTIAELLERREFEEAKRLLSSETNLSSEDLEKLSNKILIAEAGVVNDEIKSLIASNSIKEAFTKYSEASKRFGAKNLKEVDELLKNYARFELPKLLEAREYELLYGILTELLLIPEYSGLGFVSDLNDEFEKVIYEDVSRTIQDQLSLFDLQLANAILEQHKHMLLPKHIAEITSAINEVSKSKEVLSRSVENRISPLLETEQYDMAYAIIENAEKSYGEDFSELRDKVNNDKEQREYNKQNEFVLAQIAAIELKIESFELSDLEKDLDDLQTVISANKKLYDVYNNRYNELLNLYHNTKENTIKEAAYKGEQQIIPVGVFNVEKKKDAGEDADPTLDADINRSWGVLAVYDGMGGAGARKYTHKDTQEEHTSAYWASRYVKGAIEELIKLRPIGVNPVEYLESNMHVAIKQCLDKEISNFPSASSSAVSKLLAKLPTTMALCVYEIVDENLNVSCYWAGDSRVYMFDGEKLCFCTLDDANAPDGDPFSPANMDLAMNNRICQDQEFRINKSQITVKIDSAKPIILFAATDGCFGYYKNPIEFEKMILSTISSPDKSQWLSSIQQAIIDNIQQDDFSMSLVVIGNTSPESLQEPISVRLSNKIFSDYMEWKETETAEQAKLSSEIAEFGPTIEELLNRLNCVKEEIVDVEKEKTDYCEGYNRKALRLIRFNLKIDEEPMYKAICEELLEKQKEMESLQIQIQDLREQRNNLKTQLEERQLSSQDKNNEWYLKYKEFIHIVKPSQTI